MVPLADLLNNSQRDIARQVFTNGCLHTEKVCAQIHSTLWSVYVCI